LTPIRQSQRLANRRLSDPIVSTTPSSNTPVPGAFPTSSPNPNQDPETPVQAQPLPMATITIDQIQSQYELLTYATASGTTAVKNELATLQQNKETFSNQLVNSTATTSTAMSTNVYYHDSQILNHLPCFQFGPFQTLYFGRVV